MYALSRVLSSLIVALSVLAGSVALADESEGDLIVDVSGEVTVDRLVLSLKFGEAVTEAVKIYSEPSHTLIAAVMDEQFAESEAGRLWRGVHEDGASALSVTSLPAGQPSLVLPSPPTGDSRIAVWVNGDVLGDGSEETLVSDAAVGQRFSFSTSLSAAGGFNHCCSGGGCGTTCVSCSTPAFTCCLISPGCCRIACGFDPSLCVGPGCD